MEQPPGILLHSRILNGSVIIDNGASGARLTWFVADF